MSSFPRTMLSIFVAVSHFKQIQTAEINDCPKFDYEYKLLERLVKTECVLKEMENTLLQLQKEVRTLRTSMEEKDLEIQKLLDNKSERSDRKSSVFSVSTTVSFNNLAAYQLLVFNDVIYDPYKAYDTNTGIYTVPVSGTYLITGSIFSGQGKHAQTEIMAGGQSVTRLFAYSSNSFDQGANSVVVDLKAGSSIFMRVDQFGSTAVLGGRWTSMSAISLKPDSSAS